MCLLEVQILFFNQEYWISSQGSHKEHQRVSLQLCPIILKDQFLSPSRGQVLSRILLFARVVAAKTFLFRLSLFLFEVYGFCRALNSSCCVNASLKILFNSFTS